MFNELFKYYKSKNPVPEFTNVIDFKNYTLIKNHALEVTRENLNFPDANHFLLTDPRSWKIYELINHPGLIFIKNPFTALGQKYLIAKCLAEYSKFPNKSNILPLKQFTAAAKQDWWSELQKCREKGEHDKLMKSMRWVTLGYHYNWDDKIYDEHLRNEFPVDLAKLCEYIAGIFNYTKYISQAAIVNYYPLGTTLAGHTDHSERDLDSPLFSFSLGQSAIFLIGGRTKDDRTTPILLESGDTIIMSKESRVCYHAVPRIFRTNEKPWKSFDDNDKTVEFIDDQQFTTQLTDKAAWNIYENYVSDFRINVNVRQVLPDGQTALS